MANDSTTSSMQSESAVSTLESPRKSTLAFVSQFARVYASLGDRELNPLIVN